MKNDSGFSTIELLITLFVAAAFLLSGYQLYSMINKDGAETRAQAKASNEAYAQLQKYQAIEKAKPQCDSATPDVNENLNVTGLSNATVNIKTSCPYSAVTSVSKIEVTLNYGSGKSVKQATYVTR